MHCEKLRKQLKSLFWQGQELERSQRDDLEALRSPDGEHEGGSDGRSAGRWYRRMLVQHRRPIGFLIPAAFFHVFWWLAMFKNNSWYLLVDKYFMSLTMIAGSIIAGMTSEGGGAVAFPVMTLAFSIAPATARDFSVLIQSCGMTAASFTIIFMRIKCEWRVLGLCSLGGSAGLIVGFEFIDEHISPIHKKLGFVCVWFAFASVLFFLIFYRSGVIHNSVQKWTAWKVMAFLVTGFFGGTATALVGSGLDVCTFSVLTLVFRVSEKIATPTSVILMSINSIVAVIWRGAISLAISREAWEFMAVCLPVVVLGAPLGSVLGSHFHRVVLAMLVVILDTIALVTAFIILPISVTLGLVMGAVIVGGIGFFGLLAYAGHRLQSNEVSREKMEDRDGLQSNEVSREKIEDRNQISESVRNETEGSNNVDLQFSSIEMKLSEDHKCNGEVLNDYNR